MAKITKIIKNWVEYELWWAEPNVVAVTQAEYNALTPAEKADWKLRIIKDSPSVDLWAMLLLDSSSPISVQYIWVWTQAEYEALSSYSNDTIYYTV